MKLQANYIGAWRNVDLPVATTVNASQPWEEQLKALSDRLCADARGRRILKGSTVLWIWSPEGGWRRPHFWKAGA